MSLWATILIGTLWFLLSLAGLLLLLLSLFHIRYDLAWFGVWTGVVVDDTEDFFPHEKTIRLEFGFPGFMKVLDLSGHKDDAADAETAPSVKEAASQQTDQHAASSEKSDTPLHEFALGKSLDERRIEGGERAEPGSAESFNRDEVHNSATPVTGDSTPQTKLIDSADSVRVANPEDAKRKEARDTTGNADMRGISSSKDPNRFRKSLFRFATDGPAWKALLGYGIRILARAIRLLHARIELSAGHPDPAFLGRIAGHWYAVSPLLPTGGATMNFRFQDRQPTFGARVSGGFSLLSLLLFAIGSILSFPVFRLGRRAWSSWRQHGLTGWRNWVYRKIQTL